MTVKRTFEKLVRLGRGTATMMGLALMVAVVLGVATTAMAAVPGDPFRLGRINTINTISQLIGSANGAMLKIDNNGAGIDAAALDLQVEPGRAPMTVNATAGKAPNLNADKLDGKSANELGVNGRERVSATSVSNSEGSKEAYAVCPTGKVVVGTGGHTVGGLRGGGPDIQTDVAIRAIVPSDNYVMVNALEEEPTSANWSVVAWAICATAP